MPLRITVADAKASRLPNVCNLPSTDPRFLGYLNEAVQRLLAEGKWVGTFQKFRMCVTNGVLAWPRQFEAIEAVAICGVAGIPIRNELFEFCEFGFGLQNEPSGVRYQLLDRGASPLFSDILGPLKKVKVYCDFAADATLPVLLQGKDVDGNRILTPDGAGGYNDGELVLPSLTGTLSTSVFAQVTAVQKLVTKGYLRLYEYDTVALTQRAIAAYEPDETSPSYRRSLIPGLSAQTPCSTNGQDPNFTCTQVTLTVMAKMAFIPVRKDTDWLLINSLPALKAELQCIRKLENNLFDDAAKYHAEAIRILEKELQSFMGDSAVLTLRMPPNDIYGGGVANII